MSATTRSWGSIAATVFSVLSIGCIVVVTTAMVIGYRPVVITTGSMGDAAPVGSLVIARPTTASNIDVGDVLVMRRPGSSPITHRVIEIDHDATGPIALTKGDANADPDATPYPLGDEELVARWVVPGAGTALASLRDPRLLLGILGIVLIVGTVLALRTIWSDDDDDEDGGHHVPIPPPATLHPRPLPPPVPATLGVAAVLRATLPRCHWHRPSRATRDVRFRIPVAHGLRRVLGAERGRLMAALLGNQATNHPVRFATCGRSVAHQLRGAP